MARPTRECRCWLLRTLHRVGLTNLSSEEIQAYVQVNRAPLLGGNVCHAIQGQLAARIGVAVVSVMLLALVGTAVYIPLRFSLPMAPLAAQSFSPLGDPQPEQIHANPMIENGRSQVLVCQQDAGPVSVSVQNDNDRPDLRGANLRGAGLSGADLCQADLTEADLCGADLGGANLSRAILSKANLSWSILHEADLSGADLRGADLFGAYLIEVDLENANLREADLQGAGLSEANLARAVLTGADLTGADLTGADLTGANLMGCDLSEANLALAELRQTNLSQSNLAATDFEAAVVDSATPSWLDTEIWRTEPMESDEEGKPRWRIYKK